jgi:hypothetical protein
MGYGAVKYADLKNQRLTNYKFNFDQMLNLTGNTAVYLLYAHARIAGIIRKSAKDTAGGQHPRCFAEWVCMGRPTVGLCACRGMAHQPGCGDLPWRQAAQLVLSVMLRG